MANANSNPTPLNPSGPVNQFKHGTMQVPSGASIGAKVSRHGSTHLAHSVPALVQGGATNMTGPVGQSAAGPGKAPAVTTSSGPAKADLAILKKKGY